MIGKNKMSKGDFEVRSLGDWKEEPCCYWRATFVGRSDRFIKEDDV